MAQTEIASASHGMRHEAVECEGAAVANWTPGVAAKTPLSAGVRSGGVSPADVVVVVSFVVAAGPRCFASLSGLSAIVTPSRMGILRAGIRTNGISTLKQKTDRHRIKRQRGCQFRTTAWAIQASVNKAVQRTSRTATGEKCALILISFFCRKKPPPSRVIAPDPTET